MEARGGGWWWWDDLTIDINFVTLNDEEEFCYERL